MSAIVDGPNCLPRHASEKGTTGMRNSAANSFASVSCGPCWYQLIRSYSVSKYIGESV